MKRALALWTLGAALACGPRPEPVDATRRAPASSGEESEHEPTPAEATPGEAPPVRQDGTILAESTLMGTRVTINVWLEPGRQATEAGAAIEAAFDEMARLEAIMSEWQAESAVSRVNRAAGGDPVPVPAELLDVLARARTVSELTDGTFDVTFHGVGSLWKFDPGSRPPEKAEIERRLPLVDYRGVELDAAKKTARLTKPGMQVGLGAIAKGYIVDAASRVLAEHGFSNHIVEGGGDTYVSGSKGGKAWSVGVQDPNETGAVGRLSVRDEAVVTSGNYERFFEFEGRRYAHIIDPRTGWPLVYEKSPRSVTIVAKRATEADAFATAITVMGTDAGLMFLDATEDLEGVIIGADGRTHISAGLRDRYQAIRSATGP